MAQGQLQKLCVDAIDVMRLGFLSQDVNLVLTLAVSQGRILEMLSR
jgi:hypothetical protein